MLRLLMLTAVASAAAASAQDPPKRWGASTHLTYELAALAAGTAPGQAAQHVRKVFAQRLEGFEIEGAEVEVVAREGRPALRVTTPRLDAEKLAEVKALLAADGGLEFGIRVAEGQGVDLAAERRKLDLELARWGSDGRPADPRAALRPLTAGVQLDDGAGVAWVPVNLFEPTVPDAPMDFTLLRMEPKEAFRFTERDFEWFKRDLDPGGGLALAFCMRAEPGQRLRELTGRHVDQQMAVVFDGEVVILATLKDAIGESGVLSACPQGFSEPVLKRWIATLQAPRADCQPVLVEETVSRK